MCLSFLGQILYGTIMVATLSLTLAAMFTPGWRDLKKVKDKINLTDLVESGELPDGTGLFPFLCKLPGEKTSATADLSNKNPNFCEDKWNNMSNWDKAVAISIFSAAVIELLALVWTLITLCACFCKDFILHPLSIFAAFIAIFLGIAIGLFYNEHEDSIEFVEERPKDFGVIMEQVNKSSEIGYSFYLACGALVGAIVDIIVGSLTAALSKRCL